MHYFALKLYTGSSKLYILATKTGGSRALALRPPGSASGNSTEIPEPYYRPRYVKS